MSDPSHSIINLSHLDHLGEEVRPNGRLMRLIHIYAEAPDYEIVADPEEGTSCIDDVARAAVVYLRHYELHHEPSSKHKAEALLAFILFMQTDDGLFYNFVRNNKLDINKTHFRSRADRVDWWTARAVWALAIGTRVLQEVNPDLAHLCADSVEKCLPHILTLLDNYPKTTKHEGRVIPTWLIYENGADATSELLLGLTALHSVRPSSHLQTIISRLAEGIKLMSFGSMNTFPYGLYASTKSHWHLWGNAQTQALTEAGFIDAAKHEADHFYPRLLIEGFSRSMSIEEQPRIRYYDGIAYGLRCVAVGLIRLYEATGEQKYGTMAGLAASWFTGNNESGIAMYDPATGRCYDAVMGPGCINTNAGAESTIEALYALMEVERNPAARLWLFAQGEKPIRCIRNGKPYHYRIFKNHTDAEPATMGLVMDLDHEKMHLLEGESLQSFLAHESVAHPLQQRARLRHTLSRGL